MIMLKCKRYIYIYININFFCNNNNNNNNNNKNKNKNKNNIRSTYFRIRGRRHQTPLLVGSFWMHKGAQGKGSGHSDRRFIASSSKNSRKKKKFHSSNHLIYKPYACCHSGRRLIFQELSSLIYFITIARAQAYPMASLLPGILAVVWHLCSGCGAIWKRKEIMFTCNTFSFLWQC